MEDIKNIPFLTPEILVFSTEVSKEEQELIKKIDTLIDTISEKRRELSFIRRKKVLDYFFKTNKKLSNGTILQDTGAGGLYMVESTAPLEIIEIGGKIF